jgi:ribonuclease-3
MYLYNHYPHLKEGEYTEIKASIVRAESLAVASAQLGLGNYIYLSKGEEAGKGRENKNLLADSFEALIAAIFIDQGFDRAYSFVLDHLFKDVLDAIVSSNSYSSSKSRLQELIQSKYKVTPTYTVIDQQGPEHDRIFSVSVGVNEDVLAQGTGKTKKEAEEHAALNALEKVQ